MVEAFVAGLALVLLSGESSGGPSGAKKRPKDQIPAEDAMGGGPTVGGAGVMAGTIGAGLALAGLQAKAGEALVGGPAGQLAGLNPAGVAMAAGARVGMEAAKAVGGGTGAQTGAGIGGALATAAMIAGGPATLLAGATATVLGGLVGAVVHDASQLAYGQAGAAANNTTGTAEGVAQGQSAHEAHKSVVAGNLYRYMRHMTVAQRGSGVSEWYHLKWATDRGWFEGVPMGSAQNDTNGRLWYDGREWDYRWFEVDNQHAGTPTLTGLVNSIYG